MKLLIFLIMVLALLPVVCAEGIVTQDMTFNTTFNVSVSDTNFSITTESGILHFNFTTPLNASYNLNIVRPVNVSYNTTYNNTVVSNVSFNLSCPAISCNAEVITGNITSYIDANIKPDQVRMNELEAKKIMAEDNLLFVRENASIFQRESEVCRQKSYDCNLLLSKEERYNGWLYLFGCLLLLAILTLVIFNVKGSGGMNNSLGKQSMWV